MAEGVSSEMQCVKRLTCALVLALLILPAAREARADAIVRTQAMLASTIAEIYIEKRGVTVELAIGASDVNAFANLMPDEIVERLGLPPRPFPERLQSFFREDLEFRVLEYQNFLTNPELPTLAVLARPPTTLERALAWLGWLTAAIGLGLALWVLVRRPLKPLRLGAALGLLVVAAACLWTAREATVSDERAREVVASLLHNVYLAFDFREEERIYDTLDKSVAGDLLTQAYLETRRGLELANQGGARAKVKEIELLELESEPAAAGSFTARATWNVAGSVGHWGHVHQRRNQYQANLTVSPVGGAWKLTGVEILQEERL